MNTRSRVRVGTAIALASMLLVGPPSTATARSQTASVQIVGDSHGLVFTSESSTGHGTIVDTFSSPNGTLKVVGTPGVKVSVAIQPDIVLPDGHHGFMLSSEEDIHAPSKVRSVVDDLVDLGIPPAQALKEAGQNATTTTVTPMASHLQQWSGVCYDYSQYSSDGHFWSHGCGYSYIDWHDPANSAHWGLSSNYLISAKNNWSDLRGVYWRMQWPSGNMITDWEPYTTTYTSGSCGSKTFSVDLKITVPPLDLGIAESYTQDLCPNWYGPWQPNGAPSTSSGAGWHGDVAHGIVMGAKGAQSIDNPADVWASPVKNYYVLEY